MTITAGALYPVTASDDHPPIVAGTLGDIKTLLAGAASECINEPLACSSWQRKWYDPYLLLVRKFYN